MTEPKPMNRAQRRRQKKNNKSAGGSESAPLKGVRSPSPQKGAVTQRAPTRRKTWGGSSRYRGGGR